MGGAQAGGLLGGLWRSTPLSALLIWGGASVSLALSAAAYGALVGPLLRAAFGGEALAWPPLLEAHLPPPPSLEVLRGALPWLIAGVSLLKGVSLWVERVSLTRVAVRFEQRVRAELVEGLAELSIDARDSWGEAKLHRALTAELEVLERWVREGVAPLVRDGLQVLSLALTAALLSGALGVWVITLYPALMLPLLSVRKRLKASARGELSAQLELSQWALSHLKRLSLVRLYGRAPHEETQLERLHHRLEQAHVRRAHALALAPSLTELSAALLIAAGLSYFLQGVEQGAWRAEQLLSLFVCLLMMYQPLKSISKAQTHWVRAQEVRARLLTLAEHDGALPLADQTSPHAEPLELKGDPQLEALKALKALEALEALEWRELTLIRGGRALSDPFHLLLRRGVTRLEGDNGAGKSTLIYQLLGLNPSPHEARLWIGERALPPEAWPALMSASVAWLPQEAPLLSERREELLEALDSLSRERLSDLEQLTALLGLGELLTRLKQSTTSAHPQAQLQSLSGGERQRLALLLTLARPHQLLILDEPEAHLDEPLVKALASYLKAHSAARFTLLVTHHPALKELSAHALTLPPLKRVPSCSSP